MSVLQDSYIDEPNLLGYASDTQWMYQTFTAGKNYSLTSVVLLLKKYGTPGIVTVEIRPTDVSGSKPTGTVLCSGTTNGGTLPTDSYETRQIVFSSPIPLVAGEHYTIIVKASGWLVDVGSSPDDGIDHYTEGVSGWGQSAGPVWYKYDGVRDFMFATYGNDIDAGSTKYEYLDGDQNSICEVTTTWYRGQTFTPDVTFYASGVKLSLQKSGLPALTGSVFGYLTAVDESGLPTGEILATSMIPSVSITTDLGLLYEFNFNSPVELVGETKYAFWVKRDTTDGDILICAENAEGSTYDGGNSINYVGSWSNNVDLDLLFQVWGFGPPNITDQSSSDSVPEWSEVSFFVAAEGEEPLTYQWYKDAADIDGETDATLDLGSVVMSDAGVYTCVVTNDYASDESDPITLTVTVIPTPGGDDGLPHKRNIFNMPLDLDAED